MSTASERIEAASEAYRTWRPAPELDLLGRAWARGDRSSRALARVIGSLEGLINLDCLTPETLASAVERALASVDEASPEDHEVRHVTAAGGAR